MQFDEESLEALRAVGERRSMARGDYLQREGESAGEVILIESGRVQISAESEDGFEVLLAVRSAGELVGELAALDGLPRTATTTALDDGEVVVVDRTAFLDWLRARPAVMYALLVSVVGVVRDRSRARLDQPAREIDQRVALHLERLVLEDGEQFRTGEVELRLPVTAEDIADHAGATADAVARTLSRLAAVGVLTLTSDELVVHDPRALARYGTG